jgi:hypothetical protein
LRRRQRQRSLVGLRRVYAEEEDDAGDDREQNVLSSDFHWFVPRRSDRRTIPGIIRARGILTKRSSLLDQSRRPALAWRAFRQITGQLNFFSSSPMPTSTAGQCQIRCGPHSVHSRELWRQLSRDIFSRRKKRRCDLRKAGCWSDTYESRMPRGLPKLTQEKRVLAHFSLSLRAKSI